MYTSLGKYVYPEGHTYSGPATFCRYTFFASKSFDSQSVNSQVIYNSDQAAMGEGAIMLTNKSMIDRSGTNNAYMVEFEAASEYQQIRPQGISGEQGIGGEQGISFPWTPWLVAVVAVAVLGIAIAGAYTITQIKDISYSPAGNTFWIVAGIATVGVVYLGAKYFAGKKKMA